VVNDKMCEKELKCGCNYSNYYQIQNNVVDNSIVTCHKIHLISEFNHNPMK
jgi:hypothetical protein